MCQRCQEPVGGGVADVEPVAAVRPKAARKRPIALVVTAIVVVAAVGLLLWQPWRRLNLGSGTDTLAGLTRPADMPGLRYLPGGVETVVAVQMTPLLESLGPDAAKDPATALTALGLPEAVARVIDTMSVVGLKDVDQLVLGLRFSHFPPQVVLVLRTRARFDADEVDRRTKSRDQDRDGRTLHAAKGGLLGDLYWWAADDRTLVVTLLAKDFDDVPKQPRPGVEHLKPQLRTLIDEQVSDRACAWLVGESDSWDAAVRAWTILPMTPLAGRGDLVQPAGRLRSFALSVPAANEPINLTVALKTAEAANDLRTVWTTRFAGDSVEVGGEAEMIRLRLPRDAGRAGNLFGRLVGPKP